MKRTAIITSIILFIITCLSSFSLKAQEVGESQKVFADDQPVYWFYIKVTIDRHPKTKIEKYGVRLLGQKVHAGSVEEYSIQLWRHLSKGTRLAIGPFEDYYEAEEAVTFYDNLSEDSLIIDDSIDQSQQVYFYPLEVYIRERSNSYGIRRIPAAVVPGNYKSFANFLRFSLINKKLAIGPFRRPQVAEESKRLYRLQ